MACKMRSPEMTYQILKLAAAGEKQIEICRKLGADRSTVRHYQLQLKSGRAKLIKGGFKYGDAIYIVKKKAIKELKVKKPKQGDVIKQDGSSTKHEVETLSTRITTVEEALEKAKVDKATWMIERFVINKWEVGAKHPITGEIIIEELWQVKVWLKPRTGKSPAEFREKLIKELKSSAPTYKRIPYKRSASRKLLYEIALVDHHFGKLAWKEETGENYDLKIAAEAWEAAAGQIMNCVSGMLIDRFLVVLGNDMLHVDNQANTTTSGTNIDHDGRRQKMILYAHKAATRLIEGLMQDAPVTVIIVPGNHDENSMFQFGMTVEAQFNQCKDVEVLNTAAPRKYYRYGSNLLGFTHGHNVAQNQLPLLMADEQPRDWGDTVNREWHIGHFHTRRQMTWLKTDSHGLTTVRTLPALCGVDAWHAANGYRSVRMSEAYLWDYDRGLAGIYCAKPE